MGDDFRIGDGNLKMLARQKWCKARQAVCAGNLVLTLQEVGVGIAIPEGKAGQSIAALHGLCNDHCLRQCRNSIILLNGVGERSGDAEEEITARGHSGGGKQCIFDTG